MNYLLANSRANRFSDFVLEVLLIRWGCQVWAQSDYQGLAGDDAKKFWVDEETIQKSPFNSH